MKKLIVMAAALALVAASAMTAAAADWNFYGSSRVATFFVETETIGAGATSEVDDYEQNLQGNARIGANVKVSDELTGRFEYGTGVNVRILWGEWNFGAGKFGVGQHYTPLNWFYSNQVFDGDADLLPYGGVYSGREAMLQLTFGGFKVAFISPKDDSFTNVVGLADGTMNPATGIWNTETDDVTYGGAENSLPTIEASYTLKMDTMTFKLGGGYNTFEVSNGNRTLDVDSYVVAAGAAMNLGAFYVNANIYAGDNVGYILAIDTDAGRTWNDGKARLNPTTNNSIDDNEAMGFILVGGYKINDMFTVEAGYGAVETEFDNSGGVEDEVSSYYLNSTVTLAPGVFFVPEFGIIDGEENGDSEVTYYGVKWQINF